MTKTNTRADAIVHALHTGGAVDRCRSCGCTDLAACPGGCAWADRARTVCTTCLDRRFRIAPHRRGGGVALVDVRTGYRRHFLTPREATHAAVSLIRGTA